MLYGSGEAYFDNIKLQPRRSEKYTYNENNNYIEVSEDPLKKLTGRTYNEDIGTQLTFTDALNNTDNYIYNNLNQLKEMADPLTHHAYYSYNPVGNKTFTRDPRSSGLNDNTYKTSYQYNKLNQLREIMDPCGKSTSFEYDDSGNLQIIKHQNVPAVRYDYNGANLVSKKTLLDGSGIYYDYHYDDANNLESVTDQYNNTIYNRLFDGAGRVKHSSDYYNYQIDYEWDKSSNLTLVDNDTTNESIQYWYGADSSLNTITLPNAANIFYDYDENGRLFQIRYPYHFLYPGDCKTVTYYPNGWCRRIHDAGFPVNFGTTVPVSFDYFYNDNGNINKIKSWAGTDSFTNYDSNGRLKSWNFVTSDSSIIPSKSENYDYDAAGNLTLKGSDSDRYTYNAANRITNAGFSYYDDGNLQTDLTYKYEYDAENRLVRVRMKSDNYLLFEYTYNHDGLRVRKNNYLGNTITQYYWDAFGHLIGEQSNNVLTSYYYDSKGTLIGFKRNNENYLYHSNLRGDIVTVTDYNENIQARYHYDPWGKRLTNPNNDIITQPFRYAGYYYDEETGLYYCNSRYYSPTLGRFLTKDSYDYITYTNSQTMNLYSYVGNNPINNIDPLGLWTLGLNIGFSIGCGSGFNGSITFAIDDDFDFGIIASYGVTDEVNCSAGGNVFLQYTDADNISDIGSGECLDIGVSGGEGPIAFGGDAIIGNGYEGVEVGWTPSINFPLPVTGYVNLDESVTLFSTESY
jgi:RHS repeat-associated protein